MSYPCKARFLIAAEASADGKTTVLNVKQIQFDGSTEVFVFPLEKQSLGLHTELLKSTIIGSARRSLTTRGKYRNPFVPMTDELAATYLDEANNPIFQNELLEEIVIDGTSYSSVGSNLSGGSKASVVEIPTQRALSTIVKDAVLTKFSGRNRNPVTWINNFEIECQRLDVPQSRFCEVLRLYLEESAAEWYTTMRTLLGGSTVWETWRESFLNAYSCRGWTEVCNALNFRYTRKFGSLNTYMIKKLSLLVDMDPKMSENMLICCIVVGLPSDVREKLDRSEITKLNELFTKINAIDRPNFFESNSRNNNDNNKQPVRNRGDSFCGYCEKKGFPGKKHAESDCFFKIRAENNKSGNTFTRTNMDNNRPSSGNNNNNKVNGDKRTVKMVNNTEFEELFSEVNQKN